jgi:hypothetical protein
MFLGLSMRFCFAPVLRCLKVLRTHRWASSWGAGCFSKILRRCMRVKFHHQQGFRKLFRLGPREFGGTACRRVSALIVIASADDCWDRPSLLSVAGNAVPDLLDMPAGFFWLGIPRDRNFHRTRGRTTSHRFAYPSPHILGRCWIPDVSQLSLPRLRGHQRDTKLHRRPWLR